MAKILVLEDNAALRRLLVFTLTEAGHSVVDSDSGHAVYNEELVHSVDLMVTDLVMPRVDGLDAIRAARWAKADLKVIAMSGGSPCFSQDYLKVAHTFGASCVLKKPFEPVELIDAVNTTLAA